MPPEKTYAPRPCEHPECTRSFVPSHSRSLYCNVHRTPEAAAARKALREELNSKLESATEGATEDETHVRAALDAGTAWADNRRERVADGWVSDVELDHTERAKAAADEVLEVDDTGEKWVPWRWLLDERTKVLRGLRNVIAATKEAVGEAWTKDRQLAESVTAKCSFLERQAERETRLDVNQSDRLQHAMSALIEVEGACREDLDEAELAAEWISLDAEGITERASELAEFIIALRREPAPRVEASVPPGVGAATMLRAVGYRVVTVDSPRGPVIVIEGAHG